MAQDGAWDTVSAPSLVMDAGNPCRQDGINTTRNSTALPWGTNHPLLGHRLPLSAAVSVFDSPLGQAAPSYLLSHRLNGSAVLPAAALLEMALAAARQLATTPATGYSISGLSFERPLPLGESAPRRVQLLLLPEQPAGSWQFRLASGDGEAAWTQHAQGRVAASTQTALPLDLAALRARLTDEVPLAAFRDELHRRGLQLDDALAALQTLWRGDGESLCRIRLPQAAASEASAYHCHPLLLDAALSSALVNLDSSSAHILAGIDNFLWLGGMADELWCHCRLESQQGTRRRLNLTLCDGQGQAIALAEGCTFAALETAVQPEVWTNWLYQLQWRPDPQAARSRPALPAPQAVEAALQSLTTQLGTDDAAARLAGLQPQLERLSFLYVSTALRGLGWNPAAGERCSVEALAERLA
ncbi:polyketide synthase dehydratase domain-containing protein [Methylogaea oryzae]|uniref:polyketide synthase dehydratase domain-containing protein n=1 Tax=Methylogaea oryzae TaxID=1295382 RepID=UPI00138F51D7|nr:polyketide synthase dehydratase domain-containing protein [Methylogaea oryzae]